jgi:hypothetical protein
VIVWRKNESAILAQCLILTERLLATVSVMTETVVRVASIITESFPAASLLPTRTTLEFELKML